MSMRRGWAILLVLIVIAVLIVFLDVLPTYRHLKDLSILKDKLSNLKEVTDVYKKAINRLEKYDGMLNEYAIDSKKLESIFSKLGLVYKKEKDSYSFRGYLGESEFKEIMNTISNHTNLQLVEMKTYNLQEIPITFGKPKIIVSVNGKIKFLSTSLRKTGKGG